MKKSLALEEVRWAEMVAALAGDLQMHLSYLEPIEESENKCFTQESVKDVRSRI